MADPSPRARTAQAAARRRRVARLVGSSSCCWSSPPPASSSSPAVTTPRQATPATTTTLPKVAGGVSASYAATPLRSATTKGGDVAVYAAPDANGAPINDPERADRVHAARAASSPSTSTRTGCTSTCRPGRTAPPAGSRQSDVSVSPPLEYQIKVSLADHKVTLLHNGVVELEAPAAIGTAEDPTPTGTFYYTDPLDLANQPGTGYGVFAIGLSGHSNTLERVRRGRRSNRHPRHRRRRHHRPGRLPRVRTGRERHHPEAGQAPARHARRHQLSARIARRRGVASRVRPRPGVDRALTSD